MNRSRYVNRTIDKTDLVIVATLFKDGRMTFRKLGDIIDMSSPSVKDRFNKLMDAGAIRGFTAIIDPKAFGLMASASVRFSAYPGEAKRLEQMLDDDHHVVQVNRVTGADCYVSDIFASDEQELQDVVDSFRTCASADMAVVLSSTVERRLPKL
jgi:Lrp/AsnC family transcriptional regulator, leucine-responsive regulatory protein